MDKSRARKFTYDHPRPAVTVDLVIVSQDDDPRILLIRRKNDPFAGMWALPGGFIEMDESLEDAARRELHEETGIQVDRLKQLHTFGNPGRDPRGRTLSVVYWGVVDATAVEPQARDDAAEVGWHLLRQPPALAFDHTEIVACAQRRLGEDASKSC